MLGESCSAPFSPPDEREKRREHGRAKSLIKRAGEGIAPADVEEALLADPRVLDAKVMGIPHPFLGESVEACVVLRNGVEFDERRLRVAMRKRLSPHKIPSHIVAFQAFPLGSNGKVDVLRLKEMLKDRLRDLDA
jgi:fatty-acyl-CoA synthase